MPNIDERVVSMQFENKQFEEGAQQSIKTLDRLKKGLDLDASAKSLSNLGRASKSFSLAGISDNVDLIASRFTNMGVVGVTALQNISSACVNTGIQLAKSLTLDPILTGFQEYETKMNAITTILTNTQSKGTTLDDVNQALAELNEYADKTIYNFAEMTRNIGTFTAAGVDLETSVKAIKGIANLAAGSGSSAQQAANAMYQLSQALAAGRVTLQDWNSVVNAGMGGEMFQNALKETAKQMGIIVDESISFRDSISASSKGGSWLTSDVLIKTLEKFAEDDTLVKAATQVKTFTQLLDTMKESVQSGWAVSWEYIIGDREQAIQTLTAISDGFNNIVGPAADARNEMLKFWNENGGRAAVIEGLSNAFKGLSSVLKPIGEAFRNVFPPMTGEKLVELSENFRDLTANFKIGDTTITKIRTTFEGVFSIFKAGGTIVFALGKGFLTLAENLAPIGSVALTVASAFGGFLTNLSEAITSTNAISNIFDTLGDAAESLATKIEKSLGALGGIFSGLKNVLIKIAGTIQETFQSSFESFDFSKIFDVINQGLFAGILIGLGKFIKALTSVADNGGSILGGVVDILDGVKDSLEAWQTSIKAGSLLKIAGALAILTASIVVLSMIEADKLASALTALTVMFIELFGAMAVFEKISGGGLLTMAKISTGMIALSTSVLILSVAMKNLADLDWNGITKGLVSIAAISAILAATSTQLSKTSVKLVTGSVGLIAFAGAISILANVVQKIGSLDTKTITKGLIGIGTLCAELALFLKVANFDGLGVLKGTGLIFLSGALLILSNTMKQIATLSSENVIKGLGTIGALLTELAIFSKVTANSSNVISTGVGLTILAGAITILSHSLSLLGNMSWESLAKGLTTIAGSLTIFAIALKAMSGTLAGSAAMLVASASMAALAPSLILLGGMSWSGIAKGLIAIAGAFTIMGVAGALLGPITPVIIGLAGALTLMGVAVAATGAGIFAIGAGLASIAVALSSLATLGSAGAVAVATALSIIFEEVISFIPMIIQKIGEGIVLFAQAITVGAPIILEAITTIILSVVESLSTLTPQLIELVTNMLTTLLQTIAEKIPEIAQAGTDIVVGFLKAIANSADQLAQAGVDIVTNFIDGVSTKIPDVIDSAFNLIISFLNGLADGLRDNSEILGAAIANVITALLEAAVNIIFGFGERFVQSGSDIVLKMADGLLSMAGTIRDTMFQLAGKMLDAVKETLSNFFNIGVDIIDGIKNGIVSGYEGLKNTAKNIGNTVLTNVRKALDSHSPSRKMEEIGEDTIDGYILGVENKESELKNSVTNTLTDGVLNPTAEVMKEMKAEMDYGYETLVAFEQEFAALYAEMGDTKHIQKAAKAITDYGKALYEESDQYETDTKKLEEHRAELEKLSAERAELQKQIEEETKKRTETSKKEAESLKKDLEKVEESIKSMNETIQEDQNEMVENTKKAYNSLRDSLANSFRDATDPLKVSLDTQIDLFKKFETETEVAKTEILENMKSQLVGIKEWNTDLDELASKGFAQGLIDKLREMGPSGAGYVKAFMDMTSSEMEQANAMFQESSKLTSETLLNNFQSSLEAAQQWVQNIGQLSQMGLDQGIIEALGKMGTSSSEYVDAFLDMTLEEIQKFNELYSQYLTMPEGAADSLISSFVYAGTDAAQQFTDLLSQSVDPNSESVQTMSTNALTTGENLITNISTGLVNKRNDLELKAAQTAKSGYEGFAKYLSEAKGEELGEDICNGIIYGLQNCENAVKEMARTVARAAYNAAKDELGIESPSKEFAELGEFSVEGLALGFRNYAKYAENAAENVGRDSIDAMRKAINGIHDIINDDIDSEPKITPIIDISKVKDGVKKINGLFSTTKTLSTKETSERAVNISGRINKGQNGKESDKSSSTTQNVFNFEQNNYSPTALSRIDIYRQTKNQFSAMKEVFDSV